MVAETYLSQVRDAHDVTAFADDFLLQITGKNRRVLENKSKPILKTLECWAEDQSLEISTSKTVQMVVAHTKSKMKRLPTCKLKGVSIPNKDNIKYLGVTINCRLSWLPHIHALSKKASVLHQHLLRTTGKLWGASGRLLKLWYSTVVEKLLLYAVGAWATDMKQQDRLLLNKIQRPFLLRIARAFKTTSNAALHVLTGIPPVDLAVEKEVTIAQNLRLNKLNPDTNEEIYQRKSMSTHLHPSERKEVSSEEIEPKEDSLKIYTDGSKINGKVGAAFIALKGNDFCYEWQGRLRPQNSVYQAELAALHNALKWLSRQDEEEAFILSDSKSSLQALNNFEHKNPQVQAIQTELNELENKGIRARLGWVKAHVGTYGNERADDLAKGATTAENVEDIIIDYPQSLLKYNLQKELKRKWQESWDEECKGRITHAYFPKVDSSRLISHPGLTTVFTEHGPYPAYLWRFNLASTNRCVCGEEGTAKHYLFYCTLTKDWHMREPADSAKTIWAEQITQSKTLQIKARNLYIWLQDMGKEIVSSH
jgi:ribonuclease HI